MTATGGTPATTALARLGVAYTLHEYAFEAGCEPIGLQAASRLGIAPARLLKTLVVEPDGAPLAMALLAVDRTLDLKALARALGVKRAAMAPVAVAERATGYVKGGISPFGQRRRLAAVVDRAALGFAKVLVNGGRRGLQIELPPDDLVALLEARVAAVAAA